MERLNQERVILIMAGGAGTRFWPASREEKPKQFLDILGTGKSLLRQTFERSLQLVDAAHIYIVTNAQYASRVQQELPELEEDQIFLEPTRNNTAPCIALASLKLKQRYNNAVCLVAPSDHIIQDIDAFVAVVNKGMEYAQSHNALVTLGMKPTRPDTGYGYIHFETHAIEGGVHRVKQFMEKPFLEKAQEFVRAGDYLWNSGMFIWSLDAILDAFQAHAASIIDILSRGTEQYFTDKESTFLESEYPKTEKISIDYAIMERASNVFVIPASFGWSDLGTWLSLYDHLTPDANGNVQVHTPVLIDQCKDTLVHTQPGKLVVASGLQDIVIVCEDDVVLVFPRDREQEIKELRAQIKKRGLDQYL